MSLPAEWHGGVYPPGTPRPRTEAERATCSGCGESRAVSVTYELGSAWVEPEESPCCGAEWDDDSFEPDEPDPDALHEVDR